MTAQTDLGSATSIAPPSWRVLGARDRASLVVAAAIVVVLIAQATMVFTRAVNWDEFWFYVLIEQFHRGLLLQPLQTFHVRLFGWLTALPGNSLDHIIAARIAMLGCELVTVGSIAVVARRFVEAPAALLAPLAYLTAGFVMQHGFSFRTDPVATACLMSALAILARSRLDARWIVLFSLLVGLATIVTVKVVLYAPAFAGLAWMRWAEARFDRAVLLRLVLCAMGAVAAFGILYVLHSSGLPQAEPASAAAEQSRSAAGWAFFLGVPPYLSMLTKAIMTAPVLALAIAAAPLAIWSSDLDRSGKFALTGCWLPVLSPAFYTNTAAYFYVFMLAPVAVACAVPIALAARRYGFMGAAALMTVMAAFVFSNEDRSVIERQRLLIEEAQTVLPEPVAYFDLDGILPFHEKANWLMTPWTMSRYWAEGVPTFTATMRQRPVPLLVNNWGGFEAALNGHDGRNRSNRLLPRDEAALRENFIRLWGPLWIAGRRVPADGAVHRSEWLVPGKYRVEDAAVVIDGTRHEVGKTLVIQRGAHGLRAPEGSATLVWADAKRPARPWSEGDLYTNF